MNGLFRFKFSVMTSAGMEPHFGYKSDWTGPCKVKFTEKFAVRRSSQ